MLKNKFQESEKFNVLSLEEKEQKYDQEISEYLGSVPSPQNYPSHSHFSNFHDVTICARVRPFLSFDFQEIQSTSANINTSIPSSSSPYNTVYAIHAKQPYLYLHEPKKGIIWKEALNHHSFSLDFVFGPDAKNELLFQEMVNPMIPLVLSGGISTVLAFGKTGSGKTFTLSSMMIQTVENLIPFDDSSIFYDKYSIRLSVFELLGQDAYDLLDDSRPSFKVMEDKHGDIQLVGVNELEITSQQECIKKITDAMSTRMTLSTLKNPQSSRSHAFCRIKILQKLPSSFLISSKNKTKADSIYLRTSGIFFLVDLAGSERHQDSIFHDKILQKQSKLNNASLNVLKECIRNRALSFIHPEKYFHIPYRNSLLTLILKDIFDLSHKRHRQCRTVVIGTLTPGINDSSHNLNTIRYISPFKIIIANPLDVTPLQYNPMNPLSWDNEKCREWVWESSHHKIKPETLCPFENGKELSDIPENIFILRILENNPEITEKQAKLFYLRLWGLVIDHRRQQRKRLEKCVIDDPNKDNNFYEEIIKRTEEEEKEIKEKKTDDWITFIKN